MSAPSHLPKRKVRLAWCPTRKTHLVHPYSTRDTRVVVGAQGAPSFCAYLYPAFFPIACWPKLPPKKWLCSIKISCLCVAPIVLSVVPSFFCARNHLCLPWSLIHNEDAPFDPHTHDVAWLYKLRFPLVHSSLYVSWFSTHRRRESQCQRGTILCL